MPGLPWAAAALQTELAQPAPGGGGRGFTQALLTKAGTQGPSEGRTWKNVTKPNLGPLTCPNKANLLYL